MEAGIEAKVFCGFTYFIEALQIGSKMNK